MTAPLADERPARAALEGMRRPDPGDATSLAQLMFDAYRGTVDDSGESLDDARAEVAKLFRGEYGRLDLPASSLIERAGVAASATIVTRDPTPYFTGEAFVAFSMTAPPWQRQALARNGLLHAVRTLRERGEPRLHLVVTRANVAAVRLYESLGFRVATPGGRGGAGA